MTYISNTSTSEELALSIIIPAYLEEATIADTLEKLAVHLRNSNYKDYEVIVAIGKCNDRTFDRALEKSSLFENFVIINGIMPHTKGSNVQVAMLAARGRDCVYMDADLATPLHHLDEAVRLLQEHDVVNGQRLIGRIHSGHRKFISTFGNYLVQMLLLPGFKDTQCGFKGFRSTVAKDIFGKQKVGSWGFDMEVLALAKRMNYRIAHLPILDWKDMEGGTLNGGPAKAFKGAFSTLGDLLRIRLNLLRGAYK